MRTLALFSLKGGSGNTTLAHHLAHTWADRGEHVLLVDLDPLATLTAMCLPDAALEALWADDDARVSTIYRAVEPIDEQTGDILTPELVELRDHLTLLPGDLALASFEQCLSTGWVRALAGDASALRTLSALDRVIGRAAHESGARLVIVDMAPSLGAINRSAVLSADGMITPIAPDFAALHGLKAMGSTLARWRHEWADLQPVNGLAEPPPGRPRALGYVITQVGLLLSRPMRHYQKWNDRVPETYHRVLLGLDEVPSTTGEDPSCLGVMRNYHSLAPLAHEARKPMFHLRPGDGALGAHLSAVERCRADFDSLSRKIDDALAKHAVGAHHEAEPPHG